MKNFPTMILLAGALTFLAAPGSQAHHSAAMFDRTTTQTVEGTVAKFQWMNPHSWLNVEAPGSDGAMAMYDIELTSPNLLMRIGWRPTSLKTGEKVSVVFNPFHDGRKGGRIVSVTRADGTVLTEKAGP